MDDLEDIEAADAAAAVIGAQLEQRTYRDYFEEFSDENFLKNFRFDKDSVSRIVTLLEGQLRDVGDGNQRLDPAQQVLK